MSLEEEEDEEENRFLSKRIKRARVTKETSCCYLLQLMTEKIFFYSFYFCTHIFTRDFVFFLNGEKLSSHFLSPGRSVDVVSA